MADISHFEFNRLYLIFIEFGGQQMCKRAMRPIEECVGNFWMSRGSSVSWNFLKHFGYPICETKPFCNSDHLGPNFSWMKILIYFSRSGATLIVVISILADVWFYFSKGLIAWCHCVGLLCYKITIVLLSSLELTSWIYLCIHSVVCYQILLYNSGHDI